MQATCPRCGATADWTPTGRSGGNITFGMRLITTCPVIQERTQQSGGTSNFDCPDLDKAIDRVVARFRGGRAA